MSLMVNAYTKSFRKLARRDRRRRRLDAPLVLGAKVWVVDEDNLNPEADERVGKQAKKGWWNLKFGDGMDVSYYEYVHYNIFFSELEAKVILLVD